MMLIKSPNIADYSMSTLLLYFKCFVQVRGLHTTQRERAFDYNTLQVTRHTTRMHTDVPLSSTCSRNTYKMCTALTTTTLHYHICCTLHKHAYTHTTEHYILHASTVTQNKLQRVKTIYIYILVAAACDRGCSARSLLPTGDWKGQKSLARGDTYNLRDDGRWYENQ